MNKRIILASKSPRRKEILEKYNINFECIPAIKDEIFNKDLTVEEAVTILGINKAKEVFENNNDAIVIGADTIVVIDNEVLGKPKDEEDAIRMLNMLQGATHKVLTGVCIISNKKEISFCETTLVTFNKMTFDEIKDYISKDYVYDKAGSYAIQSEYSNFIKEIKGSYYNVMGMPIESLLNNLKIEEF